MQPRDRTAETTESAVSTGENPGGILTETPSGVI